MLTGTPRASSALIAAPSARVTETTGIVSVGSSPPIAMPPRTLLTISTPAAAASWALRTLTTKRQSPRSITAILPATAAALVNAVQPSVVVGPSVVAASRASTRSPVRSNDVGPKAAMPASLTPASAAGALIRASTAELLQRYIRIRGRSPSAGVVMSALSVRA